MHEHRGRHNPSPPTQPWRAARRHARPSVGVCVLTYKRNRQLAGAARRARRARAAERRRSHRRRRQRPRRRAPVRSSRSSASSWQRAGGNWPVEYVAEPERGIARARNRAVAACADVDFVAFIDDDEVPEPDWLSRCARCRRRRMPTSSSAACSSRFESPPPEVGADRRLPRTAAPRHRRARRLGDHRQRPDLPPRCSPGTRRRSTSASTSPAARTRTSSCGHDDDGALMVSADDAIVFEDIPAERTTWRVDHAPRVPPREHAEPLHARPAPRLSPPAARAPAQGVYRIAAGPRALAARTARRVATTSYRAVHRMCLGAGLLTRARGLRYEQYMHEQTEHFRGVHSRT